VSWEEDFLMRRVGEITSALKGLDVLEECEDCTTLYAADLDACPNCGHPKGEPKSRAMEGERPTPLGGVESTAGANALPPATVHGGADPNAVVAAAEAEEAEASDGDPGDDERPQETVNGEPKSYKDSNVETLRAEVKRRESVFVPSNASKAVLIDALRKDDRDQAAKSES